MKITSLLASALLLIALPSHAAPELEGRVVTPSGKGIDNAHIEDTESGSRAVTDQNGRFTLPAVDGEALLLIRHPAFEDGVVEVAAARQGALEVVLQPRQSFYEEIAVSAGTLETGFVTLAGASTSVSPAADPIPPATLTEAVVEIPGVSENGQGGIFQVVSVRGISRQRVMTMISGMRIVGERRAGVSTSFLDPMLMGGVDVIRGPSTTYYGSGALGGVFQIFPRQAEGPWLASGYDSNGDSTYIAGGAGGDNWSVSLARRDADNGEAADGSELNTGFSQTSAVANGSWDVGELRIDLLAIGSAGRDIEKSNNSFPEERTVYPEENHVLVKLGLTKEGSWGASLYVHPNDLETLSLEPGETSLVQNEAFDLGANWRGQWQISGDTTLRYGADYFGRRDVTALETTRDLDAGTSTRQRTLDEGEEDELSGYAAVRHGFKRLTIEGGARWTWQSQSNAGFDSVDDNALSGYASLSYPLTKGLELVGNVGTGLRFPSLSERFFTGTTGRGRVVGNPDLDPERSLNTDLGLRWYADRLFLAGFLFNNEIDDYIERIRIDPQTRTFVNLTSGTVRGLELEGSFQITDPWLLSWAGHWMEGEADNGDPLADIPVHELRTSLTYRQDSWTARGTVAHRDSKSDPGSGEIAIDSATLVSLFGEIRLSGGWALTAAGHNLLDEEYFPSADDAAALAPGRRVSLGFRWSPGSR